MADGDDEHPDPDAPREEVELLRRIADRLDDLNTELVAFAAANAASLESIIEILGGLASTDETIATTLTTFLTEWEAANTPPPQELHIGLTPGTPRPNP